MAARATLRPDPRPGAGGGPLFFVFLPPLQQGVLLRPPKPQRHLGGGQPGGAGFLSGFCPAPPKIHGNLMKFANFMDFREISRNSGEILAKFRENLANFGKNSKTCLKK